jgi:DNA-binding NarL/FixJ family response regulator
MDQLTMRKSGEKLRLILVEDFKLSRIGTKMVLEGDSELEVIAEGESGHQGIRLVQELQPDMVILDLGLPDLDGFQVAREIRKFNTRTKILIFTTHEAEESVLLALSAGADAYCLKDTISSSLIHIVKSVCSGVMWLDPKMAALALHLFSHYGGPEKKGRRLKSLTGLEREILRLIAEGMSNPEIATAFGISVRDSESHVYSILQKLTLHEVQPPPCASPAFPV